METDRQVWVCQYDNCRRNGSEEVLAAFQANPDSTAIVCSSGCLGQCSIGSTVRVTPDDIWYCRVKPAHVPAIVDQHLKNGQPVKSLLNPRFHSDQFTMQDS